MPKQIFVVGSSRSGTTMMGRILGSHEKVFTFHELHFFEQLWDPSSDNQELSLDEANQLAARLLTIQKDGYYNQDRSENYLDEAKKTLDECEKPLTPVNVYITILDNFAQSHGKLISCEQTPRNVFYLHTILKELPESKVIVMVRDPRDVMLSQKKKWQRRSLGASEIPRRETIRFWANYHPITMSILWNSALTSSTPFKEHPQVYFQSFEALLGNPTEELQKLCAFLDLSFSDEMLKIPHMGSSHKTDKCGVGIDTSAARRWQQNPNERTDIFICEQITKKNMVIFNYKLSGWHSNVFQLMWTLFIWPIKSVFTFLLNVRRVRNLRVSLEKRLGLSFNLRKKVVS